MKNKLFNTGLSVIILCICGALVYAQEAKKSQASVRFENGLTIVFTSETDPPNSTRQSFGSIQVKGEKNLIHRALIDTERGVYFGYDVLVEPIGDTGQFRLIFQPLSTMPNSIQIPNPQPRSRGTGGSEVVQNKQQNPVLTALALPKYPDPQIVQDGDTIAFDVLVNAKTGVKIVDLIKISTSDTQTLEPLSSVLSKLKGSSDGGSLRAKDFSVEAVEFKVTSSRLLANGQPVNDSSGNSRLGVTGALIWFYLPGHGRFILSLKPREGYNFQKIGMIQGSRISFSVNGNQYEWISGSPIITSQNDNWNLWVLHEPDYVPDFAGTQAIPYLVGAADRIEYLVKKK